MNRTRLSIASVAVVFAMLITACGASVQLPGQVSALLGAPAAPAAAAPTSPQNSAPAQPAPQISGDGAGLVAAYQDVLTSIYEQVGPSVVNIRVVIPQSAATLGGGQLPDLPFNFPGSPQQPNNPNPDTQQFSQALGSGFVWDKQGHIITNNHVVANADKIEVTFSDGSTVPAQLVGADHDSDLAVIKVDVPADKLQPVSLANSDTVKVGQLAIAIGNPFGLEGTMTVGIVSALGRTLPASDGIQTGPVYSIPDIIQTDAPINPGNSGGVLLDAQGQVIGVTAAIESTVGANAGIGFVIPSNIVNRVVPSLINSGSFEHPFLGISGTDLNPDLATAMNLDASTRGALVAEVTPGTPADKAGLRGSDRPVQINGQDVNVGGDVIVAIDEQPVTDMDSLIAYLANNTAVGQTITLTILRDGKDMKVDVTLGARPNNTTVQNPTASATNGSVWLGIQGQAMTSDLADAMQLPSDQQGILVEQVQANSPADAAGLRGSFKPIDINGQQVLVGGDVITALNGNSVTSVEELGSALQEFSPGDQVTLTILRDGNPQEITVTLAARP